MPLICQKCGHSNPYDSVPVPLEAGDGTAASKRAVLAALKVEKARCTHYMSALDKQQKELETQLKAVVYPILSLPAELTARIFVECLPANRRESMSSRQAPLLLLLVCRRWKDIAVSACELWSFLHIPCLYTLSGKPVVRRGILRGLTTWFSRAQARPLSLTLYSAQRVESVHTLCQKAISHFSSGRQTGVNVSGTDELDISVVLPRLWRLEISFPYSILGRLIPSDSLHQLQCLAVSSLDSELKAVLKHTPLLKELSWSRLSEGDLDFRWFASTRLTKLEFSWAGSAAQFLGILENFPSLSDLTFCFSDGEAFIARPPLVFPNLQSLTLHRGFPYTNASHRVPLIRLLDLVTLPQLVRLHCMSPLLRDVLSAFISRSACIVRDLKCQFHEHYLFESDPIESNMWQTLPLFPSVDTLDTSLETDMTFLFEAIDPEKDRAPFLLPKLQHLTVSYSGHAARLRPINYRGIIDVVHRRLEDTKTPALKSLHIMIDESTEWEWYTLAAEFRRLISGGLDFTIGVLGKVAWP